MADCEQLAGELRVLEQLLKKISTEHERRDILERMDVIREEQRKRGCLSASEQAATSNE